MQTFIAYLCGCWSGALLLGLALMWCGAVREPGLREDAEVPR